MPLSAHIFNCENESNKLFQKIPNLRLGTCLVEPLVATPLVVVAVVLVVVVVVVVEVVGPYLGLTILINKLFQIMRFPPFQKM